MLVLIEANLWAPPVAAPGELQPILAHLAQFLTSGKVMQVPLEPFGQQTGRLDEPLVIPAISPNDQSDAPAQAVCAWNAVWHWQKALYQMNKREEAISPFGQFERGESPHGAAALCERTVVSAWCGRPAVRAQPRDGRLRPSQPPFRHELCLK